MGKGCDYAWERPSMSALRNAGITFACRYVSPDRTGKNLSAQEANALRGNGIDVVTNFEFAIFGPLNGYRQGQYDARLADSQHRQCGGPADRPIYFSLDWDVRTRDLPAVESYFDGVKSVLGYDRTGVYGGIFVCDHLDGQRRAKFVWQTYAWSYGHWTPSAHLRQIQNGVRIGGDDVDIDQSMSSDFGQWGGHTPSGGEAPSVPVSWDINGPLDQATSYAVAIGNGLNDLIIQTDAIRRH
jgi:hypothetical protein